MVSRQGDNVADVRWEDPACDFCGGRERDVVVRTYDYETAYDNEFSVVQYRDCGLVYTAPRPVFEDLLRYFYEEDYICYKPGFRRDMAARALSRARLKTLAPIAPEKTSFLDVGCASGYLLDYLVEKTDWEVHGVEPNAQVAQFGIDKGLNIKPCSLVEAAYPSEAFDIVFMSHVLEHVPDVTRTLREVNRVLKTGGLFISEHPDFDAPTRRLFGPAWWGYHIPRHLTHFTMASTTRYLEAAGFDVEKVYPCFRPSFVPWSIEYALLRRGWPPSLCKAFSHRNLALVAAYSPVEYISLLRGHTDAMELIARKTSALDDLV